MQRYEYISNGLVAFSVNKPALKMSKDMFEEL